MEQGCDSELKESRELDESNSARDGQWKGWGDYMEAKKSKLTAQFKKEADAYKDSLNIFKGISVYVNGYTDPPAAQLKRLILKHGGEYHVYRTSRTTHVIASNLAYAKAAKLKVKDKIMRPDWITESLRAGRLLPERLYRLYSSSSEAQAPGNVDAPGAMEKFVVSIESPSNAQRVNPVAETNDPNFLQEFYEHSRLHFISTLAQELKSSVRKMQQCRKDRSQDRARMQDAIQSNRQGSSSSVDDSSIHPDDPFIAHLDLDCFFVSVSLQRYPELRGLPVVVAHSRGKGRVDKSSEGGYASSWSEIASCNYEARAFGVRNGMLLGEAQKLCPSLKSLPYDFNRCRSVSMTFFSLVSRYTADIEAISCDEMYVNFKELCSSIGASSSEVTAYLRQEIFSTTGCSASAGIGPNKLVARLATKKAKPNGQYLVTGEQVSRFMESINVRDLPGVGHSTMKKLSGLGVTTCGDLIRLDLSTLRKRLGEKIGKTLHARARGIDSAPVQMEAMKKSLSCDVNYGVRLKDINETVAFVKKLSGEVAERMHKQGVEGKTFTLKLMIRAPDATVETMKFLGHGICDSSCRSVTIGAYTSDEVVITRAVLSLLRSLRPSPTDIRGVGIAVHKLRSVTISRKAGEKDLSRYFLGKSKHPGNSADCSAKTSAQANLQVDDKDKTITDVVASKLPDKSRSGEVQLISDSTALGSGNVQHECEVDMEVLDALPESMRGRLVNQMATSGKTKCKRSLRPPDSEPPEEVAETGSESSSPSSFEQSSQCSLVIPDPSQVDQEVLQQLPESMRRKIAHKIEQKRKEASAGVVLPFDVPLSAFDVYRRFDPAEFESMRQMIISWTRSRTCKHLRMLEPMPPPIDVFHVGSCIARLIYTKYLERARILMAYLRDAMRRNPILKLPVESLVASVQEIMVEEYGAPMAMDS
uniref:DNA repair protein REV1 n=1 Tax=Trichuris muris TaxID=70415 RepID=A0A5S6QHI2_TRIMR